MERQGEPGSSADDDEGDLPDFERVKAAVFGADPTWPAASPEQLSAWRLAFRARLPEISRLEQVRDKPPQPPPLPLHTCLARHDMVLLV